MGIDYAAMAKKATMNQEKDSVSFDEGDSLVLLVPFERGYPEGMANVEVAVHGGAVNEAFKRSVVSYDQDFVRDHEAYREAIGPDIPEDCPIAAWMSENLGADDKRKARAKPIYLWAVCVLKHRRKAKDAWVDIYTKPKWMTAKQGSSAKPHIQSGIEKIFDENPDVVPSLFDLDAAQLLVVSRAGKGQFDTTFNVSLATGEFAEFEVSEEMRNDIAGATKPGAYCDLIQVVADRFTADEEEIAKKLYGEGDDGDSGKSKPSMDED